MATVPVPFGLFSGVFFKLFLTVSVFYFVTDLWTLTQHNLPEHSVRKIISGRSLSLLIPVSIGFLGGISWPLCACVSIMASEIHFTLLDLCMCVHHGRWSSFYTREFCSNSSGDGWPGMLLAEKTEYCQGSCSWFVKNKCATQQVCNSTCVQLNKCASVVSCL